MKYMISAIFFVFVAWAINYYSDFDFSNLSLQHHEVHNSALIRAGEDCVAISEQATAHLVPKVEFQKLEFAGRKANVMVRCMHDRNFVQNPAWLKYAEPLAMKHAEVQNISQDEALENLKRSDMLLFIPTAERPSYWMQTKPGKG